MHSLPGTGVSPAIARAIHNLPPLILHPFSDQAGPGKLLESSRASLMLQGLLPVDECTRADLDRRVLEGRVCELRMLFYVGKDLRRWIEQCMEFVEREPGLDQSGIRPQSFAALLINDTPVLVRTKLRDWGVTDYKAIFTRALGLQAVFAEPPQFPALADEFVRDYYRYADQMYRCWQQSGRYADLAPQGFAFELYASSEYSRMLEESWEIGKAD